MLINGFYMKILALMYLCLDEFFIFYFLISLQGAETTERGNNGEGERRLIEDIM